MNSNEIKTLIEEIKTKQKQTEALKVELAKLQSACEHIIESYGTDDEYTYFKCTKCFLVTRKNKQTNYTESYHSGAAFL